MWRRNIAAALCLVLDLPASMDGCRLKVLAAAPLILPSERNLEAAGLSIDQAVSRLLKVGQAEKAASLAVLTVLIIL